MVEKKSDSTASDVLSILTSWGYEW